MGIDAEQDINNFDEMIAENYHIYIGSKKALKVLREAFKYAGATISPNVILYEIKGVDKKIEGKIVKVIDLETKIEVLKHMKIL